MPLFIVCPKFGSDRNNLLELVGYKICPSAKVQVVMLSLANWGYVYELVKSVLIEVLR